MRNFTDALALLLSDSRLRSNFAQNSLHMARLLQIQEEDMPLFLNLPLDKLEEQAAGIIKKRFSEIKKLIPETISRIKKPQDSFQQFADTFWPSTHLRHL